MADDPDRELSSPACSMNSAGDTYMGYASPLELIVQLNGLLAAERAGTRTAVKSRHETIYLR
jgi:hypothetical protein